MKHFYKKSGFTLIELLIAVTIFSVAASVIYSSFRLGVLSWKRSENILKRYQKIRYAVNVLSLDIANTFAFKGIPFKGSERHIEFAGIFKYGGVKQDSIGRISYDFSEGADKLLRCLQPYREALSEKDSTGAAKGGEELLSGVLDFNISYCYREKDSDEITWLGEWLLEEKVPAGVKVELVIKDDYSPGGKMFFVKRINIPVGELVGPEELKNEAQQ